MDEYEGELYRMNISCTAEGLPRSGCLFFKVFGTTQVTNGRSFSLATVQSIGMSTKSFISFCSAKFNFSVQGITDNDILSETTTVMTTFTTSQVTDTSTTSPVKGITTADSKIDMSPLANETDGSDLITTTARPVKTNKINDHGAQWSEHLQLKQEALGSIPSGCPGFFFTSSWLTNVDGMKDLWCSSTVWLLSTQI